MAIFLYLTFVLLLRYRVEHMCISRVLGRTCCRLRNRTLSARHAIVSAVSSAA
ncbi:hypothetical protein M758_1G204700 [Ceratodon purpureus]|uniref:Uncharacterized protein n=1 Tax=Ceratodon purpureus TaxID=3225 RepID=A0A8T0JAL0_CERPU|nr:hypothetical protein KC19_1G216200 [Ceratodon purpureus]KAG0630799.1 hypothetical protein M758_1G204700 [Ceratodon purpureus]